MQGIDNSDKEWDQERGAIEQEVQRDLSSPTYKLITRLQAGMFARTPYGHDALGTKASFGHHHRINAARVLDKWYSPANSILVIVGDVEPAATMAKVREMFGGIAKRAVPSRPAVSLSPVKTDTFTIDSNLPYTLAVIGYRLPGTDSKDYAASQVLADVLSSQRGDL